MKARFANALVAVEEHSLCEPEGAPQKFIAPWRARHRQQNRHMSADHVLEQDVRAGISAGLPLDPPVMLRRRA
jgi:hypothetical protein